MPEHHLYTRLDYVSHSAEEFLEEIPTDLSAEQVRESKEYSSILCLYDECMDIYGAIKSELNYGKPLESIAFTY